MLPAIQTLDAYRPIYRDINTWLPAMRSISRRHGLDEASLRLAPPGSNVVFWVEPGCLIKLFAPMWKTDAAREALALQAAAGAAGPAVPRILAQGTLEDWPYLVLARMPGSPLDEIWPSLSLDERVGVAAALGRLMASLHRAPLAGLDSLVEDWPALVRRQKGVWSDPARAGEGPPEWRARIAGFLSEVPLPELPPVLLHADLNPEHIFCERGPDGWQITGVIDFGDVMIGHPYYEFVAPGFLLRASPVLRRAMLLAYGFQAQQLTGALSRQLTAFTLLHRFASLPQILESAAPQNPSGMDDLQAALWGFD